MKSRCVITQFEKIWEYSLQNNLNAELTLTIDKLQSLLTENVLKTTNFWKLSLIVTQRSMTRQKHQLCFRAFSIVVVKLSVLTTFVQCCAVLSLLSWESITVRPRARTGNITAVDFQNILGKVCEFTFTFNYHGLTTENVFSCKYTH